MTELNVGRFSNPHFQYDQILLGITLIYFLIGFLEAQFYWAMQKQIKAERERVKPVLSSLKHCSSADPPRRSTAVSSSAGARLSSH